MNFSEALAQLKTGQKIRRKEWINPLWIVVMPALYLPPASTAIEGPRVNERTARHIGHDRPLDSQPYLAAWTSDRKWQPGWLPSQADLFAEDYEVCDGPPV